jgi:hypothetical protein
MRLPLPRKRTTAAMIGTAGILAMIWHFWPQVDDTVRHYDTVLQAERLIVYEGLPHQEFEKKALEEELKTKQTVPLSGYPFYREPLDLKDEDVKALRGLLGDRNTYRAWRGEKACGGFHPDFAVEWTFEGKDYRGLICFGCSEVRFDSPEGESLIELRPNRSGTHRTKLEDLLKPYRKNRPLTKIPA